MNNVILASASPRRKELLKLIFSDFQIIPSNTEEIIPDNIPINEAPQYLAMLKAKDIAATHCDSLIIGADTCVILNDKILGKPKDSSDAYNMLSLLSGNTHKVITGCAIIKGKKSLSFTVTTLVEFYPISKEEIEKYILSNEPFDKAGGYGIQGKGGLFVKKIDGDYFNVVGLPIAHLKNNLKFFT